MRAIFTHGVLLQGASVQPRFSISPLLRQFNRRNLREKNQKLFVNVEWLRLPHNFCFFSHILNLLISLATIANGKSGFKWTIWDCPINRDFLPYTPIGVLIIDFDAVKQQTAWL